ncbi:MAG: hypothetical protein ACFFER_10745 [Candidatus Thorarchaeota archaeon]
MSTKFISLLSYSEVRFRYYLCGALPFEPTSRGIKISKIILGLSLFLPYLVDWLNEAEFQQLVIYAPTWVALQTDWASYIGPTSMTLAMIFYWLPYVYVGYQSYRFAQGKYSSIGRYSTGVAFVTILAILMTLPLMTVPHTSSGGMVYFSAVIPLPLVSILAVLLIPLLRPNLLSSAWDGTNEEVFLKE